MHYLRDRPNKTIDLQGIQLRTLFLFFVFLSVSTNFVFADEGDYQSAVGFSRYTNDDVDGDYTEHTWSGYYYLQEIKTAGKPLSLAAHLQRAPRIRLSYYQGDYASVPNLDSDSSGYSSSFSWADSGSSFTYSIAYSISDTNYVSRFRGHVGNVDRTYYTIGLGYYIEKNTRIAAAYQKYDADSNGLSLSYDSINRYSLSASKVILNSDSSAWYLNGHFSMADYSSNETNNAVGIGVEYYFNTEFNVGFEFDNYSGDRASVNGNRIGVEGRIFITHYLSLNVEVAKFQSNDKTVRNDDDILNISFVLRI